MRGRKEKETFSTFPNTHGIRSRSSYRQGHKFTHQRQIQFFFSFKILKFCMFNFWRYTKFYKKVFYLYSEEDKITPEAKEKKAPFYLLELKYTDLFCDQLLFLLTICNVFLFSQKYHICSQSESRSICDCTRFLWKMCVKLWSCLYYRG